jgi:hypothetical protein
MAEMGNTNVKFVRTLKKRPFERKRGRWLQCGNTDLYSGSLDLRKCTEFEYYCLIKGGAV